jgi:methylated-DNA-protein-cysteine methyltransferase-like protein
MTSPARRDPDAVAAAILAVVERIPPGKVTTYGAVAERAGQPRRARLVGRVLSRLPKGSKVPWHRVVAAGGRIAFADGSDSQRSQARRLRREGVSVVNGRVNLRAHGWASAAEGIDRWLWMVGGDRDPSGGDEN